MTGEVLRAADGFVIEPRKSLPGNETLWPGFFYIEKNFVNLKKRKFKNFPFFLWFSLVSRVRASRTQVHQELREREEVEKELGLVKGWIQDTRGLLLSPSADLESLLQELEVGDCTHRQFSQDLHRAQLFKYCDCLVLRWMFIWENKCYACTFVFCLVLFCSIFVLALFPCGLE